MRSVLALVAMTAVAAAQPAPAEPAPPPVPVIPPAPAPVTPPAPVPAPGPTAPASPSPDAQDAPAPEPAVDPAYGERPDPHATSRAVTDEDTSGVRRGRDIVVRYHPDRTRQNMLMMAALGGAGLVFGGIGLYYHLDATSAIDAVQADRFTGDTWSQGHQDNYDRAYTSSIVAGVSYGIGGALLLATAITYIVTEPEMETRVIRPYSNNRPISYVTPLRGGAFVGRGWTF